MMQRVVSEMETRLRKLEAELRGEKSERIKRAMQTGGMAQQAMDTSDAEVSRGCRSPGPVHAG